MIPEKLYAKSAKDGLQITLREHTRDVLDVVESLLEATGVRQLEALGLEPARWEKRFRRELLTAALLHDLGKANSYFQEMVGAKKKIVMQPLRHEAVSFWIARLPKMREWIAAAIDDPKAIEWVLWAVAGHHRKFPPKVDDQATPMTVFLSHADFHATLKFGAKRLGLTEPSKFEDAVLTFFPIQASVAREFEDAACDAEQSFEECVERDPEARRYVALLKASLIASDVAGSIRRRGDRSMADWIVEAFANVPMVEQLDGVIQTKIKKITRTDPERDRFRERVGSSRERVVFVRAGCGSGKTLAAYEWAARTAERLGRGLRVFFCYPTTGTSSEGYRDYLKDVDLPTALIHGRAEIDMELLGLGDDEKSECSTNDSDQAEADTAGALEHWSTPLVSCTVDTVLGLLQNNRRGIYLWPSVASSAVVFDEIHSYDDKLFAALLRFLTEMPGIPCLLMTASLSEERARRLEKALATVQETLGKVEGPKKLETIRRYRRRIVEKPWDLVKEELARGGKVLWVVNTVDAAMDRHGEQPRDAGALIYHSRFKYFDRVERHRDVIEAFDDKKSSPALAICTQVAEMSLDLSANLLVTELAPIPALIQRLGRLNRRAERDDPWPFIVVEPKSHLPYSESDLVEARQWLKDLGELPLCQSDLVAAWRPKPLDPTTKDVPFIWFDGGFETSASPLREGSPGIEIILEEDAANVRGRVIVDGRVVTPEEVRIPMTMPKDGGWRNWQEAGFCKVPPKDAIEYSKRRGARWVR